MLNVWLPQLRGTVNCHGIICKMANHGSVKGKNFDLGWSCKEDFHDFNRLAIIGQRICSVSSGKSAMKGTYINCGFICSSMAGFVYKYIDENKKTCVEVRTELQESVVPYIDGLVTARVTRVNPRYCKCNIIMVDGILLPEPFHGIIRKEDVRSKEKDLVEMYKCFRPNDIILAKVFTYGDALSYLLTTAENELGVVLATSEAGATLVPVSWCEMQCPKTLAKEFRKVAKVQKEFLQQATTGKER